MQKKVLTEQALYFGDVAMPKGWDIDQDKLQNQLMIHFAKQIADRIQQVIAGFSFSTD